MKDLIKQISQEAKKSENEFKIFKNYGDYVVCSPTEFASNSRFFWVKLTKTGKVKKNSFRHDN